MAHPWPGNPCIRPRQPALEKHRCNLGRVEAGGKNLLESRPQVFGGVLPSWAALMTEELLRCCESLAKASLRKSGLVGTCFRVGFLSPLD